MSSRHLKKVFGESQAQELKCDQLSSDDEVPGPSTNRNTRQGKKTPAKSAFELLQDLSDTDDNKEEKEIGDAAASVEDTSESEDEKNTKSESQTQGKKKKSKKSRKRNKEKQQPQASTSHSQANVSQPIKSEITGSVTTLLKKGPQERLRHFSELFNLDTKYLNPEFELKRIFGSKMIKEEMKEAGQKRTNQDHMIAGRVKWPTLSGSGISMVLLDESEGFYSFKFQHSEQYQRIQKQFMRAVNSHDPDNILALIRIYPYHVDSQIQLSELAKRNEDSQMASEVIELALHSMEIAVHSQFQIPSPICRLPYRYQENRAFHILLYKHLTFVGLRACHRTALELCKRLITLDPEQDPLCVSLMLDFYAIKAGECQWFLDYFQYWNPKRNLKQLPNFAYSVALSQFLLSIGAEGSTGVSSSTKHKSKTNVLTEDEKSTLSQSSDESLQDALIMFPLVLQLLLDKCGVSTDTRVNNCDYFGLGASKSASDSLKLLCTLYAWRSHHLWKDPTVLAWLEKNVRDVMVKIEKKDPIVGEYTTQRSRRYLGTPRNIVRHVLITDEQELKAYLPKEMFKETILNYDPLPPLDSIDIYRPEDARIGPEENATPPSVLSALFRSLLEDAIRLGPDIEFDLREILRRRGWRQPQPEGVNPVAAPAEAGGAAGNDDTGFRGTVRNLLSAMGDLLTVTNREPGVEPDESSSSESDEEENVNGA